PCGNAVKRAAFAVQMGKWARAGVLRRNRNLVHKTPPVLVDQYPRDLTLIAPDASQMVAKGDREIGHFKAVRAMNVPWMPQQSACLTGHADAVARVARLADRVDGGHSHE